MPSRVTMLRGRERVNVAGESHYQDALHAIAGGEQAPHIDTVAHIDTIAHLVPEPDNEHDAAAIRVEIDGAKVGYLPRALAPDYGRLIAPIAARGRTPACEAHIAGREGTLGVFLHLPPPDDPEAISEVSRRF